MLRNVLMIIVLVFTFAGDVAAQSVGIPASQGSQATTPICQAGNRNWSCGIQNTTPSGTPVTVCVETVVNGVVTNQRDITFASASAFNVFKNTAPAGTQYQTCGTTPSCTESAVTRVAQCPAGFTGTFTQTKRSCIGGNPNSNDADFLPGSSPVPSSCIPVCTPNTTTETTPCGTGFTGNQTRTVTTNTNGVCGNTTFGAYDRSQCVQTCTPNTTTETVPCGTGFTGNKTRTVTTNTNGVCGNTTFGAFNTSQCVPICTQSFTDTTSACPAGQTGQIVTRTFTNYLGQCNNTFVTQISSTCTTTCTPSTTTETTPCGAGFTGNQTRTVTTNTGGVCGNTTFGTYDRSQCVPVCTPNTTTETTPCGTGFTGNQTRTVTTNTNGVCGNTTFGAYDRSQCVQTCTPNTTTETVPCGTGFTGNKTRTVTTNTNGVCGNTTFGAFNTSQCVPVCTQSFTDSTQACPAGQVGSGIVTRTFTNYGNVCGATQTQEISRDCTTPVQEVQLLADCPYCTDHYASIGLEFNKNDPQYVWVVLVASNPGGVMGANCNYADPQGVRFDEVNGRRKIARISVASVAQNSFNITLSFRAKVGAYTNPNTGAVTGTDCTTLGATVNGFKQFSLTLNVNRSASSSTYVANATQNGVSLGAAAGLQAILDATKANGGNIVGYADVANPGLFGVCPASGATIAGYDIFAGANATIN